MNEPLRFLWFGKRSCFCCRRRCCVSEGFDMKRCWRIPSSKCRIWNNPHPNKVVRSLLAWVRIVAECSMRKKLRRHEVLLTIPTQPSSHVFRVSSPSNSKSALSPSDSPKTIGLNHICIHRPGGRQHWTNQPTSFLLGDHFYSQPTPYPDLNYFSGKRDLTKCQVRPGFAPMEMLELVSFQMAFKNDLLFETESGRNRNHVKIFRVQGRLCSFQFPIFFDLSASSFYTCGEFDGLVWTFQVPRRLCEMMKRMEWDEILSLEARFLAH